MKQKKPLILILENKSLNIKLLEEIFRSNHYEVLKACNGNDVLAILEQNANNIDLILLDAIMPDMNGFETCSAIRKNTTYKNIPIIFLTSVSDDNNQIKAFESGAADIINMPLREEIINSRIKTHLELKRSKDQIEILLSEKRKLISDLDKALGQLYDKIAKINPRKR